MFNIIKWINVLNSSTVVVDIAAIINIVMMGIVSIFYFTQNLFTIIALFGKQKKYPEAKVKHKFAYFICAHNEEAVIGNLIESIKNQDYPKELIEIFITLNVI